MINKQEQQSGDHSTNIQAHQFIVQGLTYPEVKQVALDVFRSNFYELAGKARDIAGARAEEITEEFLKKLQIENPLGFSQAEDPNFQQALFTVQKEYAVTGDKELGNLLVDLLVDRSKCEQRSILQIVLNESLVVAPKLTSDQLAALALIFIFRYTESTWVRNHEALGSYFDKFVLPFADKLSKSDSCYQHLEYSGCGSMGLGEELDSLIRLSFRGLFVHGFDATEVASREIKIGFDALFFAPCLNNPNKFQVNAANEIHLKKLLSEHSVDHEDRARIMELFNEGLMNNKEVIEKCISIRPYMELVFLAWNSSSIRVFCLTSVGIAIGHANIKRVVRDFPELAVWIN